MADSLSERISVELARGQLDLSRGPTISAIPTPGEDIASLRKCIVAIKAALDAKSGRGGSAYDQWVSMRDLIDAGSVTVQVGGEYLGIPPIGGEITDPDPRPFLSTPPTPSNLTAQGSYKHVILSWDLTAYRNHSYTEVWRATSNSLGSATAIAQAAANLYADDTAAMGTTYYYWVRAVGYAEDGSAITGAYNGVGGVMGGLGLIGNVDLGPLIVEAGNLASGAVTAAKIASGAVELTKFASGIEPVTVVSSVPGAFVTQTVYNTTNKKLYRWSGSAYVYDTPAADISGALVASQIALNIGGGNLLPNSGFDNKASGTDRAAGYGEYNNGGISTTYTAPTGLLNTAFGLQANAASGNTFGLHTGHGVVDGIVTGGVASGWKQYTTYMVSVWARKVNGAGWTGLSLHWNTGPASTVGVSQPILSTEFQRYVWRITFTSIVEGDGRLYISVNPWVTASGDVLVLDNLQVEEGDTVTAWAPRATEILPNTITTTMVADDAITTPKIIAGAIVTAKIAAGAVTANEIAANTITAGQIAANTITAGQIAADTITAGQIAAGAINASELAVGAVRAQHILVAPKSLNTDPDFLLQTARWNTWVMAYGAPGSTPAGFPSSYWSAFISRDGYSSVLYDVVGGEQYKVTVWTYRGTSTAVNAGLFCPQYDAFGTLLTYGLPSAPLVSDWTKVSGVVTITASATTMSVAPWIDQSSASTDTVYFAALTVEKMNDATLIVDGAIIAGKIAANTIVAGDGVIQNAAITNALIENLAVDDAKIANATISYGKIASIDAGTITVGTLSAARIATGSLNANVITSGTITATQIAAATITGSNIVSATITGTQIAATTITASNLNVTTLSSITSSTGTLSVTGSITVGSAGAIMGGQTAYNTGTGFFLGYDSGVYKFSIGAPAGPYMLWTGSALLINGATFETFTASISGGNISHTTASTGTFSLGSRTASGSGGTGGYTYAWTLINREGVGGIISLSSGSNPSSATVNFTSTLPFNGDNANAYARCVVTDGNGRAAVAQITVSSTNTS